MSSNFFESLRNLICVALLTIFLKSPFIFAVQTIVNPFEFELNAYRLQQYDIGNIAIGSKSWKFQLNVASQLNDLLQKCGIVLWKDLLNSDIKNIFLQDNGALLIIIPRNLDRLSTSDKKLMQKFENFFKTLTTNLAVYFVEDSKQIRNFLNLINEQTLPDNLYITHTLKYIFNDVYQLATSNSLPCNLLKGKKMKNIIGQLSSGDELNPIIVFVAHYDSHSIIPGLSVSANSNGSGVASLLEILAVFSKFYRHDKTRPQYNMIFALTAGGKYNYQGTRQFLDDLHEKRNEDNIELVICLDSLAKKRAINIHLSKNPSEKSATRRFINNLKLFSNITLIDIVSKKINLNSPKLAWEHERYNMRKIPAITLSHIKSYDSPERDTIFDTPQSLSTNILSNNIKLITEAMMSYVFNIPYDTCQQVKNDCSILDNVLISNERISTFLNIVNSQTRAAALSQNKLISELHSIVEKYTRHNVDIIEFEPVDVNLYSVLDDKITIYRTKTTTFDIVLGLVISLYLMILKYISKNLQKYLLYIFSLFSEHR
uniref:BOS complex subunit NCLN n=1 Tax=Parastrongyloides trichosuri TaxID=131310 RepID=A0A0N4ZN81_PARTI